MNALLRGEWIKFRSVRSTWVMVSIAIVLALLIAGIAANSLEGRHPAEAVAVSSTFVFVLLLVLGVQFIAQEYRFGTIRATFTAVPDRRWLLLAKVLFGIGIGLVTALLAVAGSLAVAAVVLNGQGRSIPLDARLLETITGYVLIAVISVGLGIGVGAITRNSALGITAVLVEMFVVESLVTVFVSEDLGSVLPFTASFAAIPENSGGSGLSPWFVAVLVYAAWAVGLLVIGAVIVERRDP
ncbi:MAG: ABC transporter permease [Acidimicrobiia bacterium]